MNLVNGKTISAAECDELLDSLGSRILETLAGPALDPAAVIEACHQLSLTLSVAEHQQVLIDLGISPQFAKEYILDAKVMLSREYLTNKIEVELGPGHNLPHRLKPAFYDRKVIETIRPLGVLFHIAAGNSDGLPFFTVIEGLLTGNINILKLPVEEGGLTVRILQELFAIDSRLAQYVYVFDYTSRDVEVIQRLADLADAVVVWGSDAAVKAVREMAEPNTKIIEWGHKMSFAYISGPVSEHAMEGIAHNICKTNQLLCSSCQGIFIDTESMEDVYEFCRHFVSVLSRVCRAYPSESGIGIRSQSGLRLYNESIEAVFNGARIFRDDGCSLIAYQDSVLTPSIMFRNGWVRRLPKEQIVSTLRPYKNYLQTVGLLCDESRAGALSELFWKTGAVRITDGYHMSNMYNGAAHDGEYPLRRYTKTVALELSSGGEETEKNQ